MMRKLSLPIITSSLIFLTSPGVQANVSTGTINATLTLTSGCLINGDPALTGNNFGTLNFGTQSATFSTLTTQLTGASGGNSFSVACTSGDPYTVAITGNANNIAPGTVIGIPGTPGRFLINTTDATQGVAYSLYSDSGYSSEVSDGAALPIASSTAGVDNYTLYGRIQGGGDSTSVIPGIYTDTINVSVTY
jgi:spore coat protein U-like protein